jgi:hypothetical protein
VTILRLRVIGQGALSAHNSDSRCRCFGFIKSHLKHAWLLPSLVSCRTSQRRQSNVRVLGLQRPLFAALLVAAALYCLWRSGGWLRLMLALAAGVCQPDSA